MGGIEKTSSTTTSNNNIHVPNKSRNLIGHHHEEKKKLPKGYLAVKVGWGEEEDQLQRFIIPVIYFNHPLFLQLLKEAEEEYGFEYQKGAITIPCHVDDFLFVQSLIKKGEKRNHHHRNNHNHNPLVASCFRV